jgi:hypothetical protein
MKIRWVYRNSNAFLHLDYLVNPIPAFAILVMAFNDHWLKRHYPSVLTGKLSDFTGMFYFPLLVCAVLCLFANLWRSLNRTLPRESFSYISETKMTVSCAVAVLLMIAVKTSPAVCGWIELQSARLGYPMKVTCDPTDLISLLSIPPVFFYGRLFYRPLR